MCVTLIVGALSLVGCGPQSAPSTLPTPTTTASPAKVAIDERSEAGAGEKFHYEIRYPALAPEFAPLAQALRTYAQRQKSDFMTSVNDIEKAGEANGYPWRMRLTFDLRSEGPDFVSVLGEGESFTGGDHGNPLLASFTLSRIDHRVIALPDLFGEPERALAALSNYARKTLTQRQHDRGGDASWIADGTAPKAENYAVFLIDTHGNAKASGITVLFPSYQVASYAEGPQQVDIPASVFAGRLKTEFRKAFVAEGAK
jgi:hypothetical protein